MSAKSEALRFRVLDDKRAKFVARIDGENQRLRDAKSKVRLDKSKVLNALTDLYIEEGLCFDLESQEKMTVALSHLAGVSRNLNQMARKVNATGSASEKAMLDQLAKVEKSVSYFKESLRLVLKSQVDKVAEIQLLLEGEGRD